MDISILREACNVKAKFIAVGYNSDYEYRMDTNNKIMDVCFVGAPYKIFENFEAYYWKKYSD